MCVFRARARKIIRVCACEIRARARKIIRVRKIRVCAISASANSALAALLHAVVLTQGGYRAADERALKFGGRISDVNCGAQRHGWIEYVDSLD